MGYKLTALSHITENRITSNYSFFKRTTRNIEITIFLVVLLIINQMTILAKVTMDVSNRGYVWRKST